jgi:hypothetical protein
MVYGDDDEKWLPRDHPSAALIGRKIVRQRGESVCGAVRLSIY